MLKISVIIPALNEQSNIAAAVESAQRAGASEIIVVDGGSSDETHGIALEAADIVEVSPAGRAVQQNHGASRATGDVLLFLHADCRLHRYAISELQDQLAATPAIIGGCFQQHIAADGLLYRLIEGGNLWRARVLRWAYGDQGIFVRRSAFHAIDGFPEVPIMEDLLLMKRLKRHGRFVVLNSRLEVSARRWQQRGTVTQTLRNWAMLAACHAGVTPERLNRFYPNDR